MQMNKGLFVVIVLAIIWIISFSITNIIGANYSSENKIVIVPINGVIVPMQGDYSLFGEEKTVSSDFVKRLDGLEGDNSVKAIIFEINSPGGTVVASKEISDRVKKLKKPNIALIREYGASGAYWIASASDYIIADELSVTGSIGVIGSYLEFSDLFKKYGIGYERLVAGDYKDAGSNYRKLTKNEKNLLQKKLDIIHNRFKQDVAMNRNISADAIDGIANGIFYIGSEAYDLGLVDQLGSKDDAISKAKEMAGIKDAKIIESKEKKSIVDVLSKLSNTAFYYAGKGIGSTFVKNGFNIQA